MTSYLDAQTQAKLINVLQYKQSLIRKRRELLDVPGSFDERRALAAQLRRLTGAQIAEQVGVGASTVARYMTRIRIDDDLPQPEPESVDWGPIDELLRRRRYLKDYAASIGPRYIARQCKVCPDTVLRAKIRPLSNIPPRRKEKIIEMYEQWQAALAEARSLGYARLSQQFGVTRAQLGMRAMRVCSGAGRGDDVACESGNAVHDSSSDRACDHAHGTGVRRDATADRRVVEASEFG